MFLLLLLVPQTIADAKNPLVVNRRYDEIDSFLCPRSSGRKDKVSPQSKDYWEKCISEESKKIEKSPSDSYLYKCRGDTYSVLSEIDHSYYQQAYKDYTKSTILDPDNHDAYCFRADLAAKHGCYQELSKIMRLQPANALMCHVHRQAAHVF